MLSIEYSSCNCVLKVLYIAVLVCSPVLCTMTDSGRLVKIVVDYTETVDKRLPECIEMAKVNMEIICIQLNIISNNLVRCLETIYSPET